MPDEFSHFVAHRGAALLRFGYLLTGDVHLAEDIVQDVLARLHKKWARIGRLDQPELYLRKAVLRQYLSWRRRRSSTEYAVAHPEGGGAIDDHARSHAEREAMWTLLAGLPKQQRAVLVLGFYEDMDDAAIARLIGCTASTVRGHRARGLDRLRSQLAEQHLTVGGQS